MRAEAAKGSEERESLRESEWSWRPKEREGREAQVLRREANVRWLGRVGWRSILRKWWREKWVLERAEINAVHVTTLGEGMWWWKSRTAAERRLDFE